MEPIMPYSRSPAVPAMPQKIEAETFLWKVGGSKLELGGGPGLGKLRVRERSPGGRVLRTKYKPSMISSMIHLLTALQAPQRSTESPATCMHVTTPKWTKKARGNKRTHPSRTVQDFPRRAS